MSSRDVSCGISGLTIHPDDKVGFVILGKNDFNQKKFGPKIGRSSHLSSTEVYQPFIAPVFGVYGDEGGMGGIAQSVTTKILEDIFHRPVAVVIKCISDGSSIYDKGSSIYKNYAQQDVISILDSTTVISKMPLEKTKDFRNVFTLSVDRSSIEDIEEYVFGDYLFKRDLTEDNGQWTIYPPNQNAPKFVQGKKESIHSFLDRFSSVTGLYPGFMVSDYKNIQLLESLSGMYFLMDVYEEMLGFYDAERKFFHAYDEYQFHLGMNKLSDAIKHGNHESPYEIYNTLDEGMKHFFERETSFPIEHIEKLGAYSSTRYTHLDGKPVLATRFLSMFDLPLVMHFVNRTFQPSYCGSQNGDDEASMRLQEINSRILRKRLNT